MNRIGTGKLRDLNDQIILKLLLRHQEVTKKVTQIKYQIISINYKFTDFVKTFKKSGKRRNCVTAAALKTPLFIHDNKFDGYHKKNHFVFYTARHRIFK